MTVKVVIETDTIIDAASVLRKFIGQKIDNLLRWLSRFGKVEIEKIR